MERIEGVLVEDAGTSWLSARYRVELPPGGLPTAPLAVADLLSR